MKFLLASSLFLIAFATHAKACQCAGSQPPCQAYWDASAVFVGTVTFSTTTKIKQSGFEFIQRLVRFHVDRQLRGVETSEVEVLTGFGDGDCGYGFRLGGQYLVYAYRNAEKILSTSNCTRTRLLSEATADLEYTRGLSKAAPGGTISGAVRLQRPVHEYGDPLPPVQDVRILFEGSNKHFESKTNSAGKYTISGLLPGTYKVRIDLPDGLSIHNPEVEVKVYDRGCGQAFFIVEPDTRLTGRVLDGQGMSAADVLMELVPISREENAYPSYVRTDKEGRYEMKLLKPGRYHLGVRIAGSAGSTYVPFPQSYYPGVRERSQATVISVSEGQRIELNELVLPPRFIERTLNGIVVDSDGTPVAGAVVWLKERQYDDADMPYQRQTDSEGRFSYPVYEGIKYTLNAYVESAGRTEMRSSPLTVVITSNQELIKLVLMKEK
jgi:5-hydroxyisourate hydrolase-like protein (transthyretin family)